MKVHPSRFTMSCMEMKLYNDTAQHKCPICKETKSSQYYKAYNNSDSIGIIEEDSLVYYTDRAKTKMYKVVHYKCQSCGARWHSDPIPCSNGSILHEARKRGYLN